MRDVPASSLGVGVDSAGERPSSCSAVCNRMRRSGTIVANGTDVLRSRKCAPALLIRECTEKDVVVATLVTVDPVDEMPNTRTKGRRA